LGFPYFSLLCVYVNCDFVLILILYCVILILILYCTTTYYYVFIPLEMHVRLICAIKFYLLTYLTALGRVLALTLCLSIRFYLSVCICPTATSRTSCETAERIGLIIGTGASFDLSYTVFKEILVTPK